MEINPVCVPSAGTSDPYPAAEALCSSVAVEPAECCSGRPHYQFWVEKQRSVCHMVKYCLLLKLNVEIDTRDRIISTNQSY